MNSDYKASLYDYLRYYGGANLARSADNVELTDLQLDAVTLKYTAHGKVGSLTFPLEPPLQNFNEARQRLKQIADVASQGGKASATRISHFVWPLNFIQQIALWVVGFSMLLLGALAHFDFVADAVAPLFDLRDYVPLLLQRTVFWGSLLLHIWEYFNVVVPYLQEFGAPIEVYKTYFVANAIAGFGAFLPLQARAKQLRRVASTGR